MIRRIAPLCLAGILVAGFLAQGCQKGGDKKVETEPFKGDPTTVVGKVGDETIPLSEVDRMVGLWKSNNLSSVQGMTEREMQRKALDTLIDQKVLLAASRKEGFSPTDEQVDQVMRSLMSRFGSPEDFQTALTKQGMTEDELKSNVRIDMTIRNYLMRSIPDTMKVSQEEVRRYYDEHPTEFEFVHARHILVKIDPAATPEQKEAAKQKAQGILEKIRGGADFAAIAKESSEDPGSAPNGGDLGMFGRGQMVKPFEDAAFALKPGEMSDLVETQYGFHIIRVEEHAPMPYDANLEGRLTQQLLSDRRNEAVKKRVDSLREGASIERKI